jgi:hypothetical protein
VLLGLPLEVLPCPLPNCRIDLLPNLQIDTLLEIPKLRQLRQLHSLPVWRL